MSPSIMKPLAFVLLLAVPYLIWVARRSYADLSRQRAKLLTSWAMLQMASSSDDPRPRG